MSGQEQAPAFSIQRVYLKGMSLEMPNAPAIFLESQQPSVEVAVDVSSLTIVEGIHETAVTVTLTTRVGDKVAFLIETTQAGIFEIRNVPADQMDVLVNVVCANIVFPYLRANLADAIQRTGFPPIHLADLDFGAIHQQRLEQQAAAAPSGLIVPGRA
ncbi:MAG: protein-export chaperone SecB [Betaproteobacteria bacterium]|jgi:preprotein translocase subunit SecB|nr:protein-export chaperone SecB [Betaproteobacteria bacterium]